MSDTGAVQVEAGGDSQEKAEESVLVQPGSLAQNNSVISDEGNQATKLMSRRRQLRGKITRSVNRIRVAMGCQEISPRRLKRELSELLKDFSTACDVNLELYDLTVENEQIRLDDWETQLSNDRFTIEEEIEDYITNYNKENPSPDDESMAGFIPRPTKMVTRSMSVNTQNATNKESKSETTKLPGENFPISVPETQVSQSVVETHALWNPTPPQPEPHGTERGDPVFPQYVHFGENNSLSRSDYVDPTSPTRPGNFSNCGPRANTYRDDVSPITPPFNDYQPVVLPFDAWIDNLVEFRETEIPLQMQNLSVADALYRLEASKDVPNLKLNRFDGNPLWYIEFLECFKIHVHDKHHLTDDMRMVQLRMHLSGEAERSISGLGCSGIMYATALKILKQQFGHPSVIARAFISKLTKGPKLTGNNRQGLRDLSHDVVNCVATLQRLQFFSDANTTETLRQIVLRFPDNLIMRWKDTVTEIRDKGYIPTLDHISTFLRKKVQSAFDPDFGDLETNRKFDTRFNINKDRRHGVHYTQNATGNVNSNNRPLKCFICGDSHKVPDCPIYSNSNVKDKIQLIRDNRLCFGCLMKGHMTRDCRSQKKCGKNDCTKTHHPSLHTDPPSASGATSTLDKDGILPVVRARFYSANGRVREGNVLIDSGAATTIIKKDFSRSLGLQGKHESLQLSVVGGEQINERDSRRVKFWISPISGGDSYEVEAHEINRTVVSVPPLDRQWLSSFNHLSDITFSQKAGPIDLILGVQYSHLHAEEEVRQGKPFEPVGKRTKLGWFVIGADSKSTSAICSVNFVEKIDLSNFYALETLGIQAPDCACPIRSMSKDDRQAMEMLESSCHKEGDRYLIGLPWKKDPQLLPNNYVLAKRRLESLERSLLKNSEKAEMYSNAVQQYSDNQWAVALSSDELSTDVKPVYYLPHHGVYRPDKPSTPLRVVFDPACQFNGVSLNSFLHKGPCLIGDLLGVLLRFREKRVAFVGDISKMFLQILLTERDSQVHRFLWRNLDSSREPTIYRLTRVTFGDKSSPDMASFVILKLAEEFENTYPDATTILRRDRYMDDLIHSCDTLTEATDKMTQLTEILASGSFRIKEWLCSSTESRRDVNESDLKPLTTSGTNQNLVPVPSSFDNQDTVKTLGVSWNSATDTITFQVKDLDLIILTKRNVLSKISMIYDPLGLASAVTVKARVAMQAIWRLKPLDWDDPLPDELYSTWLKLFKELKLLETVQFPRCLKPEIVTGEPELHVFADASIVAYGAVAYIVWPTTTGKSVCIVSAKVRVAPLKQTTVPRLELMAALVGSRLAKTISDELTDKFKVTLWVDSQIVLHWIRSDSIALKAFVGVRVSEIQSTWDKSHWMYVPTCLNPADDLSRGIDISKLTGRWMTGPAFLQNPKDEWPEQPHLTEPSVDEERKTSKILCMTVQTKSSPIIDCDEFSSWPKLVRVTAYCLRFVNNLKSRIASSGENTGPRLMPTEIEMAEQYWIRHTQRSLTDWEKRFKDLAPFLDNDLIRVGGRLRRSYLPFEEVHPFILPASNHISKLIMRDVHIKAGHPGSERTLSDSRRHYWIIKGRNLARETVKKCVTCRKFRQPPHVTLMADLPTDRLKTFSPVFSTTGVDLFGPFNLRYGRNKTSKAWGALFTCATSRAIHLEIVDGLSTQAFLQALRRFVAQHGWPSTFISDNGTSFVGAQKELSKLVQEGRKQIEDFAMLHKVKWTFITPLSPHQGGFYESLIKQTKRALQVAVGQQTLTWNEMSTVFAEAKCLVNSRPLGYSSNDPNDPQPLTPNHFLLGRASAEVPQGPFETTKSLHKRFEFTQSIVNQFWKRFVREYLPTLTRRSKWVTKGRQLQINDIVLLTEPSISRGKWNLARIINVFPGQDGIVRNVEVKTKTGTYRRSVQRCCPILEAMDD